MKFAFTCVTYVSLTYVSHTEWPARHSGIDVAGWTVDQEIQVRFPAYLHRVWAFWWQEG